MLIKATEQITHISDNPTINSENYFESLNYIGNLYAFINKLKTIINTKNIILEPTFKGKYTCSKYNIDSNADENEMRVFVVESVEFLEDEKMTKIIDILKNEYEIKSEDKKIICRRNEE